MPYIPESDIGLFSFRYLYKFQNGGPFSDVTTRHIGTFKYCGNEKVRPDRDLT